MRPTRTGGAIKLALGCVGLALAAYILLFPPSTTEWLTQILYRLQEPIDGSRPAEAAGDWRNVTIGLATLLGGWMAYCGLGDSIVSWRLHALRRSGAFSIERPGAWEVDA